MRPFILERGVQTDICNNDKCRAVCKNVRKIAYFLNLPQEKFCADFAKDNFKEQQEGCLSGGKSNSACLFYTDNRKNCNDGNADTAEMFDFFEHEYVFDATNEQCEKCQKLDGTTVTSSQMKNENYMRSLGFWKQKDGVYRPHPNCKCTWLSGFEAKYAKIIKLLKGLKQIYETKIPKPPHGTEHSGVWSALVWMWFFEQGSNPIHFSESSSYSKDIAKSYSISTEVRDYYKRHKKMPPGWSFTGPKTATGKQGEVEWFIGSYSITNVRYKEDGIHFTVHNVSSWHSGTRLPRSWTNFIKQKTGFEIYDQVSSAPRGNTLKAKVRGIIPAILLNFQWVNDILNHLPSFGGDWEQYYDVVVQWDE